MPALLLVLLFIVVPLAELAVIIQVGQAIGLPATIAILLVDSVLGGLLLRAQGRTAWRRFNETMRAGRTPHREALDGALVIFGGALLLTPGFLTDVVGLLLLIPPTRAALRRFVARLIARRAFAGLLALGARGPRSRSARAGGIRRPHHDVEGTASEVGASPGSDGRESPSRRRIEP
ncbi:MAG TPA: FxsA family protein [Thermoleophilaceae bacterium]|nr:FxsA family protein [Thermoleophilaceae bacterium]